MVTVENATHRYHSRTGADIMMAGGPMMFSWVQREDDEALQLTDNDANKIHPDRRP